MAIEDLKPEMVVAHLYEGKVIDVWVAYQADNPHNYVLGRTQLEARELFAAQPVIEILVDGITGGYRALCHKFKDLAGVGPTKTAAERALMRQINLLDGKVDWREMFFELLAASEFDWTGMPWANKEMMFVRKEISRRAVAAQFATKSEGEGHAETPFGE